jgi:hypothetical protein
MPDSRELGFRMRGDQLVLQTHPAGIEIDAVWLVDGEGRIATRHGDRMVEVPTVPWGSLDLRALIAAHGQHSEHLMVRHDVAVADDSAGNPIWLTARLLHLRNFEGVGWRSSGATGDLLGPLPETRPMQGPGPGRSRIGVWPRPDPSRRGWFFLPHPPR